MTCSNVQYHSSQCFQAAGYPVYPASVPSRVGDVFQWRSPHDRRRPIPCQALFLAILFSFPSGRCSNQAVFFPFLARSEPPHAPSLDVPSLHAMRRSMPNHGGFSGIPAFDPRCSPAVQFSVKYSTRYSAPPTLYAWHGPSPALEPKQRPRKKTSFQSHFG